MPLYHMLLDGATFHQVIAPTLAASWKERSFAPFRAAQAGLLAAAEEFSARHHLGGEEPLLFEKAAGLSFDRDLWKLLAGEMFLFAAREIPEIQISPETLVYLLSAENDWSGNVSRAEFTPIQQVLYGACDLVFASKIYRPEHAGYNDTADVSRLAAYLANQRPEYWTADLLPVERIEEEDRAEELEFAKEWFPDLCSLYERASRRGEIIICEVL